MFTFHISPKLQKRIRKLAKKDRVLALIFKKKLKEVISHDKTSINTYKNLKSPKNTFKRIHLTDSHILLFEVNAAQNHIIFVDIIHWDKAYE